MSNLNHPISDSESESEDDFLPPGLQSDASEDTPPSSPSKSAKPSAPVIDEEGNSSSLPSSKASSLPDDEYSFADGETTGAAAVSESIITHSFLSVPEGLEPKGTGGDGSGSKKTGPKKPRKRRPRKSGDGESPRRRKKKKERMEGEEDEKGDGDGQGKKKGKRKTKNKNKPANLRRNIKTFLRGDQLDVQTLEAQREEEERKKRLEEERKRRLEVEKNQKAQDMLVENDVFTAEKFQEALEMAATIPTLEAAPPSITPPPPTPPPVELAAPPVKPAVPAPPVTPIPFDLPIPTTITVPTLPPAPIITECIMVDSGSDSEKDAKKPEKPEPEVITISSDEEDVTLVSDHSEEEAEMAEGSSGMHTNDETNVPDVHGRVLVNVNHPPDEPDIYLPDLIARVIKPHQVGGIRFLYDNLVESLHRFKMSSGFGCILAHSMGLGKTLQCIGFINIFMRYTNAHTVLCIVPINTLQNWLAEFDMWCQEKPLHFNIFVLNDMHKTTTSRAKVIAEWHLKGGVLLMGYEMYRLLARSKQTTVGRPRKRNKTGKSSPQVIDIDEMEAAAEMEVDMKTALCNPGPDMVVCDEGHRIKNSHAGISQTLKNIKTRRRVVLTGYPLQNNLQEYWCMVDFVRPNFLGSRHEFANLFERPISNGQCMDSTPTDVRLMRYRAHVLHSLLAGFVQRRGFNVLFATLPPKEEHVILVRLTSFQRGLYIRFMQCFKEAGAGGWCTSNPLKAFSVGCKIWNHPDILSDLLTERDNVADDLDADLDLPEPQAKCNGKTQKGGKKGTSGSDDRSPKRGGESSSSSQPALPQLGYVDKVQQIISFEWAREIMKNYKANRLNHGGKMIILFHILEESIRLGDKILVFSQSLSTLSLIEKFLAQSTIPQPPNPPPLMPREWIRNKTYFRLDGSTAVSEREKMINQFNSPDNKAIWLFLLSTKAGCLGINLIGANRVVVMDASWNPCHDAQAVCRVYRYGQTKKCFVYRLVSDQTLEKKIYDRQISKQGMSDRVVDEMNPEVNLTKKEVESLLEFDETDMPYEDFSHLAEDMPDTILQSLVKNHSNCVTKAPFTTESLLWDRKDMKLTRAEKMQAKKGYEEEKKLNLSYSRPSYSAFYPKGGPGGGSRGLPIPAAKGVPNLKYNTGPAFPFMSSLKQPLQRPVANVRPIQSTPVPRLPATPLEITQKRIRDLKNAGVTLQRIVATTDIMLPGANVTTDSTPLIKAGEAVTFIKTKKGIYLRTPEGKILAVRGQGATTESPALNAVAQGAFPDSRPSDRGALRLGALGGAMAGTSGGQMGGVSGGTLGGMSGGSMGFVSGGLGSGLGVGGGAAGGLAILEEQFGNSGQPPQPSLANSQLGQLLSSNTMLSQPFNTPNLPMSSQNDLNPSAATNSGSSTIFPFLSLSSSDPPPDQRSSASTLSSNLPYNAAESSTPFSLANNSMTLTMSTDTTMHSTLSKSASAPILNHSFPTPLPPQPMSTLTESQSAFPDSFKDSSSPSPSFSFPSFGDDTWNTSSQGSLSMDQGSVSAQSSTMVSSDRTPAGSAPTSFAGMHFQPPGQPAAQNGNSSVQNVESSEPLPASTEGVQSISLPSSLPYPQMDMKYSFPTYSQNVGSVSKQETGGGVADDGSDIANLTRFVDASFPHLMPFPGSLNPDQDSEGMSGLT